MYKDKSGPTCSLTLVGMLCREKEDRAEGKEGLPDLLSKDMYREMMRKKWEEEEEDLRQKGPGSVHYQNVRFDGK